MSRREYGGFPQEIRKGIRESQRNLCAICGSGEHLTIHHKIPLSMGGTNDRENAIGLCRPCHEIIDTITIEHKVPFEEIMEKGIVYQINKIIRGEIRND